MVAIEDALDHYFVRHPRAFFEKGHEAAVVDPSNRPIMKKHLVCAAAELPLRQDDAVYPPGELTPNIAGLAEERALRKGKKADVWFSVDRRPHREVGIRAVGERFSLVTESGRAIGELSGQRVYREAFPGAVYLHMGRQYRVIELDLFRRQAVCRQVEADYYTQPLSEEKTEILLEEGKRDLGRVVFTWGRLRITRRVTGFDKKRTFDRKRISTHTLDMPEHVFETEGIWTAIGRATVNGLEKQGLDLAGSIHAAEHSAIAAMPLFSLCDRGDIGGLSHTEFPAFRLPAIFIYDGHEGGIGLSRRALDIAPEWFRATLEMMRDCPCESGCPSCVQDPHCGNRNEPLNKKGAIYLLGTWV